MDITQWSPSEVRQALEAEGFETDICDTFLDQGIDGSLIKGINSGDLAEMGLTLKLGPKKRLLSFLHNIGQSANNPDKVHSENLNASCSSQAETVNTNPEKVRSENLNASCSSQVETANTNPDKVHSKNLNASCSSQVETANTNPEKVRSENLNASCSSQAETANTNPEKVRSENLNASCSIQAETANTNPDKVRSENLNATCSSQAETANTNPKEVRDVVFQSRDVVEFDVVECDVTVEDILSIRTVGVGNVATLSKTNSEMEINFLEIMMASEKGKIIVQQFIENDESFITVPDRKKIVKIACSWMQQKIGLYPSSDQKSDMAAAIVKSFPCLGIRESGSVKHDHYYDPKAGGFLETRLKTLRKNLPAEQRKRKASGTPNSARKVKPKGILEKENVCEATNQEMLKFKVRLMQTLPPTYINRRQIRELFEETYTFRQQQQKLQLSTPTQLFAEYPRMLDTDNGVLILDDFRRKYPQAKDLYSNFTEKYLARVNRLMELDNEIKTQCNDEFLASILNVMKLLPEIRRVKCRSFQAKLNLLVQFVEENTEIEEYVNQRTEAEKAAIKQPFLLCTGSLAQPLNFFLVIEGSLVPLGQNSSIAFNVLFCSFFVFQLHYPPYIKHLFHFFEQRVVQIASMSASTADFVSRLESIQPL